MPIGAGTRSVFVDRYQADYITRLVEARRATGLSHGGYLPPGVWPGLAVAGLVLRVPKEPGGVEILRASAK